jgi:hypothetical protein
MALFLMKNKSIFYQNDITYKLLNLNLENDYFQLEKAFDIYKKMFEPIVNLQSNDKIGIQCTSNIELFSNNTYLNSVKINFKLYLDKYKFFQSISRWYWNQKRLDIFDKLLILFEEYKKILDKVKINEIRNNKISCKFIFPYIVGLENLADSSIQSNDVFTSSNLLEDQLNLFYVDADINKLIEKYNPSCELIENNKEQFLASQILFRRLLY